MGRIRITATLAIAALTVAGCAQPSPQAMVDLRERFVAAGGLCSGTMSRDEPIALAALTCDEGATLVVFNSTTDRADFIKSELETNEQIRARTHVILSKETWLVVDKLAVIVRVMPLMGGMISGRNGANP